MFIIVLLIKVFIELAVCGAIFHGYQIPLKRLLDLFFFNLRLNSTRL
jgi:hypothetical protein